MSTLIVQLRMYRGSRIEAFQEACDSAPHATYVAISSRYRPRSATVGMCDRQRVVPDTPRPTIGCTSRRPSVRGGVGCDS
jgi:hypothetical protein